MIDDRLAITSQSCCLLWIDEAKANIKPKLRILSILGEKEKRREKNREDQK
jgi:hypothetical protein